MVGWDFGCLSILTIAWITFFALGPDSIRLLARRQDASRPVVSILVIAACVTSLIAILDLLSNRKAWVLPRSWEATIYLTGVFLSWFLLHTSYTFRYAHFYYGDHPRDPNQFAGGLQFPGGMPPCYMDFAYFSFVIGMTFQVSDVAITSPRIRKAVLMHGLLSFIFNTVIVALTINEVVNLRS
jgi:uncharacterized membrane protein